VSGESPIVDEVRRRRRELSARYGDDVRQYAEHLKQVQCQYASRLVSQITVVRPVDAKRQRL
jgi:hypothetical protein